MTDDDPYIFAVDERDISMSVPLIARVWARLGDAGYAGMGFMPPGSAPDLAALIKKAGITRIEHAYDNDKMRYWFKVWPKPPIK